MVTSHSVNLSGLSASTLYHYQAQSQDAQGNLGTSADFTFTTSPPGPQPLLQLHADATEISGLTNGSVVTPATAPAGFTGTVVVNGTGSANFTPAQVGNGVYFLNCCVNTNNAYYKFTGTTVGNIFNVNQGQISFYLKSRYSFAQRQSVAGSARFAFDVRDGNGHLFYFATDVTSGALQFIYEVGGTGKYYFVPSGTEDALFGNGVTLKVALTWDGSVCKLYLNDTLVQSWPYTIPTANWTAASIFDLGAYEYQSFGGYNTSDDVIDEFMVSGPAIGPDTTPPAVSMTGPVNGAVVTGTVNLTANATDNVAVTGVQFTLDGANLGGVVTGVGPLYSYSWNTKPIANGTHTLAAIATDAAGNTATSSISVTVNNDTTPPAVAMTGPVNGATVTGTVSLAANATDNVAVTGVQFTLDGANLGNVVTGSGPSYSYSWNTTAVTNGVYTLAAVASDAAGNSATSSISVTVNNPALPPAISGVSSASITSSGATISWTTDKASSSRVAYGATSGYGLLSAVNPAMVTSHSVNLSGLSASTLYHYQAQSQDAQGNLGTSADFTFTTSPPGPQPLLQLHADATEISGLTNGSVVTPATAPAGFTGTVVVNGTGSANFTPAQVGNGVYFLNCCVNTNNAYYKFTGTTVGNIFNVNQGQISFYLKSRYSFAQRQSVAGSARFAFDVRDGNGHLFYFFTSVTSGFLQFTYQAGGTGQYYYVPSGTEDTLFGNGVTLKVALTWDGSVCKLYLNDTLVQSW